MRRQSEMARSSLFVPRIVNSSGLVGVVLLLSVWTAASAGAGKSDGELYKAEVRPLLARYCFECHGQDVTEADIDLSTFESLAALRSQTQVWVKVRRMLDTNQMPPKDASQPNDKERTQLQTWVREFLAGEAKSRAGDPGPVLLRRLSNAEYTYTIRDLTGVDLLNPTREFPIDGAAGEGFTNVGSGQGMSPAMLRKYLDAAKGVTEHVVLLPEGIRFSPHTTRRDQTNELLAEIQAFYRRFTADGGGSAVNLQGIRFTTNQGGMLPLERYLAATLEEREFLKRGEKSIEDVARQRSLSPKYLTTLWNVLSRKPDAQRPSPLIDPLREKWLAASSNDVGKLAAEIKSGQDALWKFNSIGHVGREGGPTSWMEEVAPPVVTRQELRHKLIVGKQESGNGSDVVFYLVAGDNGDGNASDFVVFQQPRIEFVAINNQSARKPIMLRDLRGLASRTENTIASQVGRTTEYLDAAAELHKTPTTAQAIAREQELDPEILAKWMTLLRLGERSAPTISGHFTNKITRGANNASINGWGSAQTPSLLTNSSQEAIAVGTPVLPARGVTMHPSPTLDSVLAWRSAIDGQFVITGLIADADNKCGNGATWQLEHDSATGRELLASGVIENGEEHKFKLDAALAVRRGDVVSLVINARDKSHICDTTHVSLTLTEAEGERRVWDLSNDVVDKVLPSESAARFARQRRRLAFLRSGIE